MSDLQSQLGPDEEVALRRVALGFSHGVASGHIRRLEDLYLIKADKTSWRHIALGAVQVFAKGSKVGARWNKPIVLIRNASRQTFERLAAKTGSPRKTAPGK